MRGRLGGSGSPKIIMGQLKLPTQGATGGILIGGDAVLYRGAASLIYLDHTRLILSNKLQFRDADIYISSKDDGHLDLDCDSSIDLNQDTHVGTETSPKNLMYALLNRCKVSASVRATPQEGDLKLDDVNHKLQFYNGSAWETINSAI